MKLRYFGVNVGHDPVYDPRDIARAGFNSIRIVAQPHVDLREYNRRCHAAGVSVAATFPGESFNGPDGRWSPVRAADFYVEKYAGKSDGSGFDVWLVGNEGDGQAGVNTDGSSIITALEFNDLSNAFIPRIRKADASAKIYAIGTVTGDPGRIDGDQPMVIERDKDFVLIGYDGLDNHAYAQWPDTVGTMLGGYDYLDRLYGLPERMVSEFGWPDPDAGSRGRYIRDMVRSLESLDHVVGAYVYCWDLAQHSQPFGLTKGGKFTAAIPFIQELGYSPQPVVAEYTLGFKDFHDHYPDLLGAPLFNVTEGIPFLNQQRTANGVLTWCRTAAGAEIFTFFECATGRRFRYFIETHLLETV